jgi:signal transduction histidine kinase/DNA-binding response OmpR family regulator/CHASE3 domain sensor protein
VVLLVAVGAVLGLQLARMASDAHWVDHTDEVIGGAAELQKQIIDQETGLRGYLLTEDRVFLEPFMKANPRDGVAHLRALVQDNPAELANVDELSRRYEYWLTETAGVLKSGPVHPSRSAAAMLEGKREMDSIRAAADTIYRTETELRHERTAAAASSVALSKVVFLALFGGAGVVLAFLSRAQLSAIARTFESALEGQVVARRTLEQQEWVRTGQVRLGESLRRELAIDALGEGALSTLASYVGSDVGAFFTPDGRGGWQRRAGFALDSRAAGSDAFKSGEGVIGRAALSGEVVHLRDVPPEFFKIRSGTGEHLPAEIVVVPAQIDGVARAVIELGFFRPVSSQTLDLLGRIGEAVGMAMRSAEYQQRLQELLEESQRQGEELQAQEEELRVANEELEEQTSAVRLAQKETETRQALLEETNARLEEQTNLLQRTQRDVTEKAAEVERASRYKSEFLANMSHELRTPLNSSLILAKLLADNKQGNLTPEQVRFAETISLAGNDLLTLINDILDLSKIEAGKIDLHVTDSALRTMTAALARTFEPLAGEKKIAFSIVIDDGTPETLVSDAQRVEQILRNLLSNAIKFTDNGSVSLRVSATDSRLRFAVTDSGIGIRPDQQGIIFDAFRQADGGSNRRHGGTGLGLSISRDLAKLLGGDIEVRSEVGKGSVFTFSLPLVPASLLSEARPRADIPKARPTERVPELPPFADDRDMLDARRRSVLIIEDDVTFARLLLDLAHEVDFQAVVANDGDSGLSLAKKLVPSAIFLDIRLPDHSGLSLLDRLKHDPGLRHIPVHVVSAGDYMQAALSMGAVGYMMKPVKREELVLAFRAFEERLSRRLRRLLIVEDDDLQRESMTQLLTGPDVEIVAVPTVSRALEQLRTGVVDCVVTDLTLPDASGFELLEQMSADDSYSFPPVIVYTGRSLTSSEEHRLRKYSSSIIVKGARSPERLLDEATLFLHQVESELPPERQRMLRKARDRETVFDGRRVLVAEDDVRNIFALTSVFEPKGMSVSIARNGHEAIAALEGDPSIDLVLMDIMMPEMDGIEAIQRIRQNRAWAKLPVIALTAKAMKDDRERCLKAGANDYIAKPIDVEMLLSLLRVWMPR